ncbi:MAG: FAD:protein FMN transferase [Nitrospinae bacterium]|nr:FAD:protein FMN transferase [Nitrospinota bacterium]
MTPLPRFYALVFISLLLFSACGDSNSFSHRRSQFLMGTLVEISVNDTNEEKAQASIQKAFREIRRLENLMSGYIQGSEISKINQSAGKERVTVSEELMEVLQRSLVWSEKTEGAFDITIGPVQNLWNFDQPSLPSKTSIEKALSNINFKSIQLDKNTVFLFKKNMKLDLGAIAKGYAVDRAIEILKENKINHALVNAGGDLRTIGKRSDNLSWKIGLQHPRKPESLLASLALSGKAVATSGDYQKYFELDGKRYHHILDPKTGYPSTKLMSATVITNNVMDADALSTALFVLGPEKGIALLDSLKDTEGLIVNSNGKVSLSKNMNSLKEFSLKTENIRH